MAQYASVSLDCYTDADYSQAFRQQFGDGTYNDFSGCTLRMQVRKEVEDVEAVLSLESNTSGIPPGESGIWIYDPGDVGTAGLWEFTVTITRRDLQQIPEGVFVQSLIMENPDGIFIDIWRGTLTNTIGPTRNPEVVT